MFPLSALTALTPKQKRLNWWHYHKWHVALGVAVVAVAVYLLTRALGFWEVKADYQVAYVGAAALPLAAGIAWAILCFSRSSLQPEYSLPGESMVKLGSCTQ